MKPARGLRWVVAGQFVGALADNALLLVALALLTDRQAPAWVAPALRIAFYLSYVLLQPFAGALADAVPKKWVLLAINLLKLGACGLLLARAHPLIAYALVGVGAASHAPARYGILAELSEPTADSGLLAANAWMEIATVMAMLLGSVWGSLLLLGEMGVSFAADGIARNATCTLAIAYLLGALCALPVRGDTASDPRALDHPRSLLRDFRRSAAVLWADPMARVSVIVTSIFWAAAAVLQFVVLRWATERLHLSLASAGLLQVAVALGMICGAAATSRWIREQRAMRVLPLGLGLGAALMLMTFVTRVPAAAVLLFFIGALSGLLLVPMNTVLQRRGLALLHPGQSIAVQTFSENMAALVGLSAYGAAVLMEVAVVPTVAAMGVLVVLAMLPMSMRRATPASA